MNVQFAEGVTKIYDVSILFEKHEMFLPLKGNPALFGDVLVDQGGYGVVWNDDIDISCDELWENGATIKTPFDGLMAFSDDTFLWDLNESTLRKAISYGKQALLGWSAKRELAKINYHIHTDAIKDNLIPQKLTSQQISAIYASEADVLNMALFGMTAKEWRDKYPGKKGNIRTKEFTTFKIVLIPPNSGELDNRFDPFCKIDTLVIGSPILQDGKIVGAVTHVLVYDLTRGYGIFR